MIYKYSRYTKTPIYTKDKNLVFKNRERFIFNLKNATMYMYKQGDRLDLLAKHFYGTSQLYWVILDANPKYRSEFDIPYGTQLVIPSFAEVMKCLQ